VYGVPGDLDLSFLHGAELIQVCLGQYQLQFHFHPVGTISVEGGWELRDAAGVQIDGCHEGPDRPPYQLHRLLGRLVVGSEVSAPVWFALVFDGAACVRRFNAVRVILDPTRQHLRLSVRRLASTPR
jgi:hypothetical protein